MVYGIGLVEKGKTLNKMENILTNSRTLMSTNTFTFKDIKKFKTKEAAAKYAQKMNENMNNKNKGEFVVYKY